MVARRDPPWETAWAYMARITRTLAAQGLSSAGGVQRPTWRVGHHAVAGDPPPNAQRQEFIKRINERRELMPGLSHVRKPGRSLRTTAKGQAPTRAAFEANAGEHIAAVLERAVASVVQPKWRKHIDRGYGWGANGPAAGWNDVGALTTRSVSTHAQCVAV